MEPDRYEEREIRILAWDFYRLAHGAFWIACLSLLAGARLAHLGDWGFGGLVLLANLVLMGALMAIFPRRPKVPRP
jgi:hypothetical protein